MKSKPVRFGRALVLTMLTFITLFSLFGGASEAGTPKTVHIVAGSLMLVGSAVHLATNLDWVKAVFSRLRILERIRLSPEGFSLSELKRATKALVARGTRVLTFSFHSPSVAPGHTPYVADVADLRAFLELF